MLLSRRRRWRRWRLSRPFWGGLFAILAGAWICVLPLAPLKVMLQQGVAGIPSVLMGIVMVVLGLTAWFSPSQRALSGVLTTLIATAALVLSNLGGFLIGTLLGILGGGLMFAWQPYAAQRAAGAAPAADPDRTADGPADRTAGPDPTPDRTADRTPVTGMVRAPVTAPAPPRNAPPPPTPHSDPQGAQP
ncbi:DUF6114 domain-containing protein [Streptomyces amritsarensis]|uniref:DUF6114 domain-containing protein n=1 Tax=Streptomyces amritsarensis TaxID=681158 RepID=UPI0036A99723